MSARRPHSLAPWERLLASGIGSKQLAPPADQIEGFLITNPPVDGFIPEMCMRYVER